MQIRRTNARKRVLNVSTLTSVWARQRYNNGQNTELARSINKTCNKPSQTAPFYGA